jgi:hypothetical protein
MFYPNSTALENKRKEFAEALQRQERTGIYFDENKPEDSNQKNQRSEQE